MHQLGESPFAEKQGLHDPLFDFFLHRIQKECDGDADEKGLREIKQRAYKSPDILEIEYCRQQQHRKGHHADGREYLRFYFF
jgi:hypothetical protein